MSPWLSENGLICPILISPHHKSWIFIYHLKAMVPSRWSFISMVAGSPGEINAICTF